MIIKLMHIFCLAGYQQAASSIIINLVHIYSIYRYFLVLLVNISVSDPDPHDGRPPGSGSGSAWTYADPYPDPGGKQIQK